MGIDDIDKLFGGMFGGPMTEAQNTIIRELKRERTHILHTNEQLGEKAKRLTDRAITLAESNNALRQENKRLSDEIKAAKILLEEWAEGRPIQLRPD